MAQNSRNSQKKVNVEDLLRLKQAERPNDDFWETFDQELHQRMLQTLVKKDPWYVQIMRGFSLRFVQSVGLTCTAAILALVLLRPVFIGSTAASMAHLDKQTAAETSGLRSANPVEIETAEELNFAESNLNTGNRDYTIEVISGKDNERDAAFQRDFDMDSILLAAYDQAAYKEDTATVHAAIETTAVASLVF